MRDLEAAIRLDGHNYLAYANLARQAFPGTPIVPGVWQLPGGRVESDLGGQRLIEAPDGLILIE